MDEHGSYTERYLAGRWIISAVRLSSNVEVVTPRALCVMEALNLKRLNH